MLYIYMIILTLLLPCKHTSATSMVPMLMRSGPFCSCAHSRLTTLPSFHSWGSLQTLRHSSHYHLFGFATLDLEARSKVLSPRAPINHYKHSPRAREVTTIITWLQYTSLPSHWWELTWPAGPEHLCPEHLVWRDQSKTTYMKKKRQIQTVWKRTVQGAFKGTDTLFAVQKIFA